MSIPSCHTTLARLIRGYAGIEALFLTIASKLVEQKVEIETERTLRSKDSIMITDEHRNAGVNDPTRVWGCC